MTSLIFCDLFNNIISFGNAGFLLEPLTPIIRCLLLSKVFLFSTEKSELTFKERGDSFHILMPSCLSSFRETALHRSAFTWTQARLSSRQRGGRMFFLVFEAGFVVEICILCHRRSLCMRGTYYTYGIHKAISMSALIAG